MTNRLLAALLPFLAAAFFLQPLSLLRAEPTPDAGVAAPRLPAGESTFIFDGWDGPAIKVWTFVPEGVEAARAPILIVMHGLNRDADRYLREWRDVAREKGIVAIFPEFSRNSFQSSREYNLGNVTKRGSTKLLPRSEWSFAAIEPLFDEVVERIEGTQTGYTLYGHSAGSQFVHRFLLTQRETRAQRYISANAGWYTLPTFALNYPDGINGLDLTREDLETALATDTIILLGDADNDENASNLNQSEGAMRQGEHRFARGRYFYAFAKEMARREGWIFNWSLRVVPGVGHDNGAMAKAAGELVEGSAAADSIEERP